MKKALAVLLIALSGILPIRAEQCLAAAAVIYEKIDATHLSFFISMQIHCADKDMEFKSRVSTVDSTTKPEDGAALIKLEAAEVVKQMSDAGFYTTAEELLQHAQPIVKQSSPNPLNVKYVSPVTKAYPPTGPVEE